MIPYDEITDISIDIETYSERDLSKSGVHPYSEDPSFEILLFGYSINYGPVQVVDLTKGEKIPEEILKAFDDRNIKKWAYNCMFERVCLSKYVGHVLDPEGWYCTMVWVATLGLPLSLEEAGAALGLEKQKMKEGKELIKYFCVPCKPTKTNGGRTRNLPEHDPEKWATFISYNERDVQTEMGIQERLKKYPVPDMIWEQYHDDQRINDNGVLIDMTLANMAIKCDTEFKQKHMVEARTITGLDNPNSTKQLSDWLVEQGVEAPDLSKKTVQSLIDESDGEVEQVLTLRQQMSKSSVKKYNAMIAHASKDNRARGLFQFYGAHTGRFISRGIQLQNLPRNYIDDLPVARSLIRNGCFEGAELLYDSVTSILSQLIRTSFIASPGHKFIVADYSAIEARCVAWLAGETWRQRAFARGEDIYCASAKEMFKVNVVKGGENGHLRMRGKIAELALGYGGSVGALISMGALDMGLSEEELKPLVDKWRASNPHIKQMWWDIDADIVKAVKEKTTVSDYGLTFQCVSGMLFIKLPSGRRIAYVKPRIDINPEFGREQISYMSVGQGKKFIRVESYGPKFVENIIQGIARDVLVEAMHRLLIAGYKIVMHIHDEVVIEAPMDAKLSDVERIMSITPDWAPGLLLNADGFESEFYKKEG